MQGPKCPFLLRYRSRDTRRIDFPRVDGLSTDPRVLGCHQIMTELYFRHKIVTELEFHPKFLTDLVFRHYFVTNL